MPMRTGTVATTDNRKEEELPSRNVTSTPDRRFSQSRAVALDMESATIAANGFHFRVPCGTLLCVSDKPLHGEIKLPGIASNGHSVLRPLCMLTLLALHPLSANGV
jgi:AMP nucleosidase